MRFIDFFVSRFILGISTFRELYNPFQGKEQSDIELFLQVVPFIYYATWSDEENWIGKGGRNGGNRSSITGRIIFHILFICNHYLYLDC